MRTNQARKTGPALLDRPNEPRAAKHIDEIRRAPSETPRPRREHPGTSTNDPFADEDTSFLRARSRRIRRGLIPQTRIGRIVVGVGTILVLAAAGAASFYSARLLHKDPHFLIASSSAIENKGNHHLSRSQLLSIFGEDIDRNIFDVPMAERRQQLEQMPWVEHANVMRLLPNRLRIKVVERTPIAFVRQGASIGMADASGVLLDIPPDAPGDPNYSFPVVTGLKSTDTPESREQRMHLYSAFLHDLDSEGKKISTDLSEIDLSDPEDVRALLPTGNTQTLVHFGTEGFLSRYKRFQEHIGEWRTQYPRLSGVDMRYERQVVLQMPPKDSTVASAPESAPATLPKSTPEAKAKQAPSSKPLSSKPPVNRSTAGTITPKPVPAAPPITATERDIPSVSPAPPPAPKSSAHNNEASTARHSAKRDAAHSADMAKRVDAIKAWMARRQAAHNTQAPQPQ